MKISGKGVKVILLFLVGIPLIADLVMLLVFGGKSNIAFGMTLFHLTRYIIVFPVYIVYLVVAFAIIKEINKYRDFKL